MLSTNTKVAMLKNLIFHKYIEKAIKEIGYGVITVNVVLKDGEIVPSTVNLVRQRRKKYKLKPLTVNQ